MYIYRCVYFEYIFLIKLQFILIIIHIHTHITPIYIQVVHLGHVYVESNDKYRSHRVRSALTIMGSTVVAGAITTFGSGAFMFSCQMVFFSKMAFLSTFLSTIIIINLDFADYDKLVELEIL